MVREFSYPKEDPPAGVKRDLEKIKKAAEWQTEHYKNHEKERQEDSIELGKHNPEAKELFNEARHLVSRFLKNQEIDAGVLDIDEFDVYATESKNVSGGQYNLIYDKIYVNKSQLIDREKLKKIFVHEIFHKLSFNGLHMAQYSQKDDEFIKKIKSGYSSEYSVIEAKPDFLITKEGDIFKAFNEGVTELLTYLAFKMEGEKYSGSNAYAMELAMASAILFKAYGREGFKEFIKNYFSGKMMHLRRIEKYYGKKSLSLLAQIKTRDYLEDACGDDKELLKRALEFREVAIGFFITDDDIKKQEFKNKLSQYLK